MTALIRSVPLGAFLVVVCVASCLAHWALSDRLPGDRLRRAAWGSALLSAATLAALAAARFALLSGPPS